MIAITVFTGPIIWWESRENGDRFRWKLWSLSDEISDRFRVEIDDRLPRKSAPYLSGAGLLASFGTTVWESERSIRPMRPG